MNIGDEVIQRMTPSADRAVACDGEARVSIGRGRRDRALPSALIMIPVVALLGVGVAVIGLSAMATTLSRTLAAAARIDEDPAEDPWVYEPGEMRGSRLLLGSVYTR